MEDMSIKEIVCDIKNEATDVFESNNDKTTNNLSDVSVSANIIIYVSPILFCYNKYLADILSRVNHIDSWKTLSFVSL